jgi:hypothetical protein
MVLILPLIPIAMAFASGLGILAELDARANEGQAQEIAEDAQSRYEYACEVINQVREETQNLAAQYGELKIAVGQHTVGGFEELKRNIDLTCSYQDRVLLESFEGAKPQQFKEYKSIKLESIDINQGGIVADILVGAVADKVVKEVVKQGVYALVGLGTASTGTAISGLSGIASQNATLAWLGGGSLAAGGGGMALGGLVLGGITLVPTLLFSGFRLAKGEKALTDALEYQSEVDVTINEIVNEEEFQLKLQKRICELGCLVEELDSKAYDILDRLYSRSFERERDTNRFKQVALLIKALVEIINTPVLNGNGKLNPETKILLVKYSDFQG